MQSNFPNPFGNNTIIRYFRSEMDAMNDVSLNIYDQKGVLMAHYNLDKKAGEGEMSIKTENLQDGMFFYSLVVNGKVIDSKVMLKVSSN